VDDIGGRFAGTELAMNALLGRALFAFLVLPGTFAFLVPVLLLTSQVRGRGVHLPGLIPLVLGTTLLLWCVREFYVAGKGTLAPWAPPQKLVVTGPYRYSRNPIYIAVGMILCGWALAFHSRALTVYAVVVMFAFHFRVVLGEEPWLAQTHGEQWVQYKARVPRWLF
jgi:protein-S-isoprenylcysteine O-methyltransferase Ste14